jgi:apolipoprotein N-acyltransferase
MSKGTTGILHVKLVPTDVRTFYNKHGDLLLYLYLLIVSIKIYFVRMRNA